MEDYYHAFVKTYIYLIKLMFTLSRANDQKSSRTFCDVQFFTVDKQAFNVIISVGTSAITK